MNKPLVSVVIPTYNAERSLARSLKSIKNQTYKDIEVIIIDNRSKDKTVEIAKKFGSKVIVGYYNKPEARNAGVELSRGIYVLHADCDFVLEPNLIKEAVEVLQNETCEALFIPERYEGNGFWRGCRNLEKKIYEGNEIIEAPRIYKKSIFEKFTFDEKNEGSDEYDFYFTVKKNLGLRTSRINSRITLIEPTTNLKKRFNQGKYYDYYQMKYKGEAPSKQMSFNYRAGILKECLNYSKTYTFGLILIKSISYSSFFLGRLAGKFDRKIQRLFFEIQDVFNPVAKTYEENMFGGSLGNRFVNYKEKEAVLNIVKEIFNNKKIKVLDVGAGNGRWSKDFLNLGFDVTAVDLSEEMCNYLKKDFKKLKVIKGDISKLNVDEKFDLVFSFRSLKYVNNRQMALDNIRNILRDGGYGILEMPNLLNPFYFLPYYLSPFLSKLNLGDFIRNFIIADFVSKNSFERELKIIGFEIIMTDDVFFMPHWVYSNINNQLVLDLVYSIDRLLSKIFPRSIVYVVRK